MSRTERWLTRSVRPEPLRKSASQQAYGRRGRALLTHPAHRPSAPERTFDVLRRPDIFTCYRQGRTAPYPSRVAPLEPCLGAGCLVAHRPGFDPPRMERGRVACGVGIEVGSVLVRRARCFAQSNPGEAHRSGSSAACDDRNRRADPGARGRLPAGSQGQSPAGVGSIMAELTGLRLGSRGNRLLTILVQCGVVSHETFPPCTLAALRGGLLFLGRFRRDTPRGSPGSLPGQRRNTDTCSPPMRVARDRELG